MMEAEDGKEPLLLVRQHNRGVKLCSSKCAKNALLITSASEWLGGNYKHLIRAQRGCSVAERREGITDRRGGLAPDGPILLY
jgi:hypothetical protein